MVFDWDDHGEQTGRNAMCWMVELKKIRPDFKATLFAVPAWGSQVFWRSHPDWIELAVHGHDHHSNYECAEWGYARMVEAMLNAPVGFVRGFKAPGWQISNGCYEALQDCNWWVADQHLEDHRRPIDLPVYLYEDGQNWHGHVTDVCGNGLNETWEHVKQLVRDADCFEFASENAHARVAA